MPEDITVKENLAELPEPARRLHRFIGNWQVSGVFRRDGKARQIQGRFDITPAAGGFGLLARMNAELEEVGTYEEWDLLGYDPGCDEYHIFSVTNGAVVHDHRAEFVTDDRVEFFYKGLQEHERFRETGVIEFRGADEFTLTTTNKVTETVVFEIDIVLKRDQQPDS